MPRRCMLLVGLVTVVAIGACADGDSVGTSTSSSAATDSTVSAASPRGATATAEPPVATQDPITSSPSASSGPPSATEPAAVSLVVEASQVEYEPDSWTVAADEDISIELDNRGGMEHDWTILALGERITKLSEFEDDMVIFQIHAVPPKESVTETFRIDEPGTYQVICSLTFHFNAGMGGTLIVR